MSDTKMTYKYMINLNQLPRIQIIKQNCLPLNFSTLMYLWSYINMRTVEWYYLDLQEKEAETSKMINSLNFIF